VLLRKVVSVVALISADCRSVRMSELRVLLTAPPEATGLVSDKTSNISVAQRAK